MKKVIIGIIILFGIVLVYSNATREEYPSYKRQEKYLVTEGKVYDTIKAGYMDFDLKVGESEEGTKNVIVYAKIDKTNAVKECDKFVTNNAIIVEIFKDDLIREGVMNIEFNLITDNKERGQINYELKDGSYIPIYRNMRGEYEKAITSL